MTTIHPLPAPPPSQRRSPPFGLALGSVSVAVGVGAWLLLSGPQRGVALGGAFLVAGGLLLGPKLREYAGLALVTVGGLLGGVSLLWLLVFAPVIDRTEHVVDQFKQSVHDLTHPSISAPRVDVGGAVKSGKDAVTGLIGGRP